MFDEEPASGRAGLRVLGTARIVDEGVPAQAGGGRLGGGAGSRQDPRQSGDHQVREPVAVEPMHADSSVVSVCLWVLSGCFQLPMTGTELDVVVSDVS